MEAVGYGLANAGALVVFSLALLVIARALRQDVATGLAERVAKLEKASERQINRIHQLETAMRDAGVPVPPWPAEKETAAA